MNIITAIRLNRHDGQKILVDLDDINLVVNLGPITRLYMTYGEMIDVSHQEDEIQKIALDQYMYNLEMVESAKKGCYESIINKRPLGRANSKQRKNN